MYTHLLNSTQICYSIIICHIPIHLFAFHSCGFHNLSFRVRVASQISSFRVRLEMQNLWEVKVKVLYLFTSSRKPSHLCSLLHPERCLCYEYIADPYHNTPVLNYTASYHVPLKCKHSIKKSGHIRPKYLTSLSYHKWQVIFSKPSMYYTFWNFGTAKECTWTLTQSPFWNPKKSVKGSMLSR